MRVLILSANTGGGHNSCATALAERFERMGVECEIEDAISMISEKVSGFISWGHSYVYRKLPKLFGTAYRFEERHPPQKPYDYLAKGAVRLREKLLSRHFDAVICVHVFAGMMVTELRRRYQNDIPSYFVATDYTCSPGVSSLDADAFFIPHRMLFAEFVRREIPAHKLFATGIPVKGSFLDRLDKQQARRILELEKSHRVILLGCGSIGCGHLERHAIQLAKGLPANVALVVLCGRNEELANALAGFSSDTFRVVGYTDKISLYLSAADVYLTKPGGLMTTEAIAKRLPMVFVEAVPGCETRNLNFLSDLGIGEKTKNWKQAIAKTISMVEDDQMLEKQKKQMEHFHPGDSGMQICQYVLGKL